MVATRVALTSWLTRSAFTVTYRFDMYSGGRVGDYVKVKEMCMKEKKDKFLGRVEATAS